MSLMYYIIGDYNLSAQDDVLWATEIAFSGNVASVFFFVIYFSRDS